MTKNSESIKEEIDKFDCILKNVYPSPYKSNKKKVKRETIIATHIEAKC
jgi:hypothetical protein